MRTKEEIACQILQSAVEGATQTTLMYETYLSHEMLRKYLKSLIDDELLEYVAGEMTYRTTAAGRTRLMTDTPVELGCKHQCKKCGMIYICGSVKCQNSFHHGRCTGCEKSFTYFASPRMSASRAIATERHLVP